MPDPRLGSENDIDFVLKGNKDTHTHTHSHTHESSQNDFPLRHPEIRKPRLGRGPERGVGTATRRIQQLPGHFLCVLRNSVIPKSSVYRNRLPAPNTPPSRRV